MNALHPGASGDEVKKLQTQLAAVGFPPGKTDGEFGPSTEAALLAFQHSTGLLADGVAGPRTLAALGLADSDALPSAIPQASVAKVCVMFPNTPRANIEKNLPFVLDSLLSAALQDKPMVLMALATIRAETESFLPVTEGQSRYNTSPGGQPYDLYDRRADLGNTQAGDGAKYCGRGFIQLTGKTNYRQHGLAIGEPLLEQPERANEPAIAAALLASFIKAKERQIKEALMTGDLRWARKLVNGGSHGLERFEDCWRRGMGVLTGAGS
ncbi:MAG: peptidoglycan-binding protein [Sulfuricellaceae bacterium]